MTVAAILGWFSRWKIAMVMSVGIALRVACVAWRFGFWMDEASLIVNINRLKPIQMFGPLLQQQLAPPGFLILGWCVRQPFGPNPYVMRSIPLASAVAAMFLFLAVTRRCLPARAVFPAVVMFAFSTRLIYYASEFKQYSTDLALGLACVLVGLATGSKPLTAARACGLASFGAVVVWFSHPSIFLLASVGLVALGQRIAARDGRSARIWLAIGLAWLVSFTAVHHVATRQLAGSDMMFRFWDFAFPPLPPHSFWDATWVIRRLAYFFINPLDFGDPFDPRISLLPALGLAIVGANRLWKIDRSRWLLLALPLAAVLAASSLKLYPFHGRVVLFLVPSFLIAIAAGLDAVLDLPGRLRLPLHGLLFAFVVVIPAIVGVDTTLQAKWSHNSFGDLHPADVDPYKFPL